jgi:hypothetical protein
MSINFLPDHHLLQACDPDPYSQHDRWAIQQLKDYQARALRACREYAYAHSPFYQQFHRGLFASRTCNSFSRIRADRRVFSTATG